MNAENLIAWQGVFIGIVILVVGTVLTLVLMRHLRSIVEARAAIAREGAYHDLALSTTAEVARLADEVAELRRSVSGLEQLLREVEA